VEHPLILRPAPRAPQPGSVPLSLYVHVPWCLRKCPYCDFNSHPAPGGGSSIPEDPYLDALRADLEDSLPRIWGRTVHSVFLGGGTPSLLSAAGVARLLSDIRARLPLAPDCEVTLEANPGTFEAERFRGFRDAGVNRLSLGIQSFDDARLRALGRVHGADEARHAAREALAIFSNVNLDLMSALPGQDLEGALADVRAAIALAPAHLSVYSLTLEPGTPFHRQPPAGLPDEETVEAIDAALGAELRGGGFEQYEVSAWAQPGRRCRHNLNYWTFGDYLGIGAGAHGKLTLEGGTIVREERHRAPSVYLEHARRGEFVTARRAPPPEELAFEYALCAFRLAEGFAPSHFERRTGLPFARLETGLARARARGLVEETALLVRASERGRRFLSDLQEQFLAT